MALPSTTLTTLTQIGRREDLSDRIYLISPTHTPFLSGVPTAKATSVLHEWQLDTLRDAAANAVIEGDDATTTTIAVTVRLANSTQISDEVPRVTGTAEAVRKAGRNSELGYQIAKSAAQLKRDMEFILLANTAEDTGSTTTTARNLGSIGAWITANTDNGPGGSDGSLGNTARTDGTQRAFTEAQVKNVLQQVVESGGDPDCVMVGTKNKQQFSTFTGNATREINAQDKELIATIQLYESDFGVLEVLYNRFQRARDCLILQKDMWAVAYLRPFQLHDLAKTGDSERRQLLVEYTLESRNEAASGLVADLTT